MFYRILKSNKIKHKHSIFIFYFKEKQLAQLQMIKVPTNKLYYYYDLGATTLLQGGSMCELSSTMVNRFNLWL